MVRLVAVVIGLFFFMLWSPASGWAGEPIGGASSILCDEDGCTETRTVQCRARAFAFGQQCWSRGEGAKFVVWLRRHGSTPAAFERRHPELAAKFRQPWPPVPYWRRCTTGRACAVAVIGRIFGGDISYEMAIVSCETGGTFSNMARGSAGERGWWQIHPTHFWRLDESQLWDVRYNTRFAYRLSSGGRDFSPWTCA